MEEGTKEIMSEEENSMAEEKKDIKAEGENNMAEETKEVNPEGENNTSKETLEITKRCENKASDYGSTSQIPDKKLELNEFYQIIGMGLSQFLYWLLVALVAYSDYAELTLLSVIVPSLRCEWNLTSTFETAITMSAYGSYALSAVLLGRVADRCGRKSVIKWSTLLVIFAAVAGALSPNKWIFLVTRLVAGACIGINLSCIVCYSTEFAENSYWYYGMAVFGISAFIGDCVVSCVVYLVFETVGWRWLMIIVSAPAVPALVLILALPESPRFLCVSGQQERAMQAVRFMAYLNGKELPENTRMTCSVVKDLGSFSVILNKDHRKSTIALSAIYFSNIFIEFGLIVLLPLIFSSAICGVKKSLQHQCQLLTRDDLWKLAVATTGSILGTIAALLFARYIGRLMPIRIASFIVSLWILSLFVCVNQMFTFVTTAVVKIFESFVNTTIWIMIPESFPTNIRSTATGFINAWGKTGGVLGTGCVYLLFYDIPFSVLSLFLCCSIVGFLGTMLYDRDTKYDHLKEI